MPPARSQSARLAPPRTASARGGAAGPASGRATRAGAAAPGSARAATARTAPQRESRTAGFQPRRVTARGPLSRIRWDRAARLGLVAVLMIIAYLWISGIVSLVHSHAQATQGLSQVHQLVLTNRHLRAEQAALHQKSTILSQARDLGMVRQGEQSFIFTGR